MTQDELRYDTSYRLVLLFGHISSLINEQVEHLVACAHSTLFWTVFSEASIFMKNQLFVSPFFQRSITEDKEKKNAWRYDLKITRPVV